MLDQTPATQPALSRQDYKTIFLASLGGALEFYDFIIFVFFTAVLGQLFFPPELPDWTRQFQTFGIFAAGYLARPIGGIIMAHFGDLHGRKRIFTLSVASMALPTFLIGLLPTYANIGFWAPLALLLLRILQGIAIGSEVPGAWVFIAEHSPPSRIGFTSSVISASLIFGILLGSLSATCLHLWFSPETIASWAWRLPFLFGAALALVAVTLRRQLTETPVFLALKRNRQLAQEMPIKTVLSHHKPAVALSMVTTWCLAVSLVVTVLITPSYLQKQLGISPMDALLANSLASVALIVGCVVFGTLGDRIGRGQTMTSGSVLLTIACYLFYRLVPTDTSWLYILYALLGFAVGVIGVAPLVMVQAFPAHVRYSGVSFSYNIAHALAGGISPIVLALWLRYQPQALLYYLLLQCLIAFLTGIYLCREENHRLPVHSG